MKKLIGQIFVLSCFLLILSHALSAPAAFEPDFTRYYDYVELTTVLKKLADAYPEFLKLESIGKSYQQRDLWAVTVNNPKTGPQSTKAAMYIQANIHGNEIQGSEVCLYTIWYLMENYGKIEQITELIDQRVFYILPCVNPDGRAYWFEQLNTSHSSRGGQIPTDNDHDWLLDEDGYDDLDGDGEILQMRVRDPEGRYKAYAEDARLNIRAKDDELGEYTYLGSEGIDNDGDGRVNEDGPGGYDTNRNWPSLWRPNYIQYGAGDYPLSLPESQAIAAFILARPNIAGVQGYHNSGGMILRGPGVESAEEYPPTDLMVYSQLGEKGEDILPLYRYLVIYKDLYNAYGGFITWTYESLGIFSFTNELFSSKQYSYKSEPGTQQDRQARYLENQKDRLLFNDYLEFGSMFVPWKPFQHPTFGEIEIGGWKKYSSRINPQFMLPELCHRNCAFTLFHARQMPQPEIHETEVKPLKPGVFRVRVGLTNQRLIPTISTQAQQHHLYRPDVVTIAGPQIKVISAGLVEDRWHNRVKLLKTRPERIVLDAGLWFKKITRLEWIVAGKGSVTITVDCLKGGQLKKKITF